MVGIGTSNPIQNLYIVGNAQTTGRLISDTLQIADQGGAAPYTCDSSVRGHIYYNGDPGNFYGCTGSA